MPEETLKQVVDRVKATIPAIGNAIVAKGGTVSAGDGLEDFAADIATIPSGGIEPAEPKDVNFYDYDGTCLYAYTSAEAQALTELPPLPTRYGLICQGWNWSLTGVKSYVSKYGVCDIGAMYITDDGKTRLYITIADEGRMNVTLYINLLLANGITVDWGDGSGPQLIAGSGLMNFSHTYNNIGNYVITLFVDATGYDLILGHGGSNYTLMGPTGTDNTVYRSMLRKVELGDGVRSIGSFAFASCYSLESITIPSTVANINQQAFYQCTSLKSAVIPLNNSFLIGLGAFYNCQSLISVIFSEKTYTLGGQAFSGCSCLRRAPLPSVVNIATTATFNNCLSLSCVIVPEGVGILYSKTFYQCLSLASIVFYGNVTRIDSQAFYGCYGVAFYDFTANTVVPTLSATDAFTGIAADCQIRVPASLEAEWKSAANWSTYANYIVGV